jgi:release factor glutamine methyltransferase
VRIQDALNEGTSALKKVQGLETPYLDALLLLCAAIGKKKEFLLTYPQAELDAAQYKKYKAFIKKRANGICSAYLIGEKEFYGHTFLVNKNVLVPRPDTETLVSAALDHMEAVYRHDNDFSILDLCCGSGAIALSLLHAAAASGKKNVVVYASDISKKALKVSLANAKKLNLNLNLVHGNLFKAFKKKGNNIKFDIIVSNPPYVRGSDIQLLTKEVRNEPRLALDGGTDGLDIIRCITADARSFLKSGARLFLEADPAQMPEIRTLLAAYTDIRVHNDLSGNERVISARA